jgi:DNA-directed RNA polymerase specialized sigma subunit
LTKDELKAVGFAKDEVERLRETIAHLETLRISPRITAYGTERVQSSVQGDVSLSNLERIDDLIEIYNAQLAGYLSLIERFTAMLETLNVTERAIMKYRYWDCLKWEEIAYKINYQWSRMHEIHKGILNKISEKERTQTD